MGKREDQNFHAIVGIFMALWGFIELNNGTVWLLTLECLFPLFILTIGTGIVARTLWRILLNQ